MTAPDHALTERVQLEMEALQQDWTYCNEGYRTRFCRGMFTAIGVWSNAGATLSAELQLDGAREAFEDDVPFDRLRKWLSDPRPTAVSILRPAPSLSERLLSEIDRLRHLPIEALIGPWGEADRLEKIIASCAPTHSESAVDLGRDDGVLADAAHDRWIDEQNGVR